MTAYEAEFCNILSLTLTGSKEAIVEIGLYGIYECHRLYPKKGIESFHHETLWKIHSVNTYFLWET